MPDWRVILAEHLRQAELPGHRREEIVRELAGHLEEHYVELCRRMPEEAARERVLASLSNPRRMAAAIERAEQEMAMNERTRMLWIPGMTVLLLSALLLRWLYAAGTWSEVFWFGEGPRMGLVIYPWWLLCLPLLGAAGAYLALRAGADARTRMVAGVFPAAAMLAFLALQLPLLPIADPHVPLVVKVKGMGLYALQWVIIPGVALLFGAIPTLRARPRAEAAHA